MLCTWYVNGVGVLTNRFAVFNEDRFKAVILTTSSYLRWRNHLSSRNPTLRFYDIIQRQWWCWLCLRIVAKTPINIHILFIRVSSNARSGRIYFVIRVDLILVEYEL